MEKQRTRKDEISRLNVLLCLLVIFIHVSSGPVSVLDKDSWQFAAVFFPWKLSAFVVQGFIFLSGLKLFASNRDGFDYEKLYLSRLTKIIIPYLVWNIIYYAYFIRRGYFDFNLAALLKYIVTGTLVSPFYFVIIIIQFYLFVPLSRMMVKRAKPVLMLALCAAATLFISQGLPRLLALIKPGLEFKYKDRVFTTYLFYWVAGCYAGENYAAFKRLLRDKRALITCVFAVCALAEAALGYASASGRWFSPWLETVHFCYCVSAVFFAYMLSFAVSGKRALKSRLVRDIDQASYKIFLSHCFVLFVADEYMRRFGITRVAETYLIRIITVYFLTIVLCVLWDKLRGALRRLR